MGTSVRTDDRALDDVTMRSFEHVIREVVRQDRNRGRGQAQTTASWLLGFMQDVTWVTHEAAEGLITPERLARTAALLVRWIRALEESEEGVSDAG